LRHFFGETHIFRHNLLKQLRKISVVRRLL
jgi:hypothetical protein